eukprot:Sspe_Gene.37859::Locus_18261_Transcript_1_3_Confidence_0.400_Length_2705::g.37859::m.37859
MGAVAVLLFAVAAVADTTRAVYRVNGGAAVKGVRDGTADHPFVTVQECVDYHKQHGNGRKGVCRLSPGVYREEVQLHTAVDIDGNQATFDGTEPVPDGGWEVHKGKIYKKQLPEGLRFQAKQVFVDRVYVPEARWPNSQLDSMLDVRTWALTEEGTVYGMINDSKLAATGIDFTGALAVLNLKPRVLTVTRTVENHAKGSSHFNYSTPLPGVLPHQPRDYLLNIYFLKGILDALDSPGEWYIDPSSWTIYIWMPDSGPPGGRVSLKVRDVCLNVTANGTNAGNFTMHACTVHINGHDNTLDNAVIEYPSYSREIAFRNIPPGPMPNVTMVNGDGNLLQKLHISHSNDAGLLILGSNNRVTDALVEDTNWLGTLDFPAIQVGFGPSNCGPGVDESNDIRPVIENLKHCGHWLHGKPSTLTMVQGTSNVIDHVTVTGFGNSGVVTSQLSNEISFAHISQGGLIGCDNACLHADNLPTPCMYNTSKSNCTKFWHHNWVHNCREKCVRGDDATVNLTTGHNVIFNCGEPLKDPICGGAAAGLVIKGDYNVAFASTIFNISAPSQGGFVPQTRPGPPPPACGRPTTPPCVPQNAHSIFVNIASHIVDTKGGPPLSNSTRYSGGIYNGTDESQKLQDPFKYEFAPSGGSPLRGAGVEYPPYTPHGKPHPDIGAYDASEPYWRPGCTSFSRC